MSRGLLVPNSPGLPSLIVVTVYMDVKQTLTERKLARTQNRSCVQIEVDVLGSRP